MQVTKIYYEKVFPILPFVNEKVGVTIDLLPGEDQQEAFELAKTLVNNWGHKLVEQERPPDSQRYTPFLSTASGPYSESLLKDTKADKEFADLKNHLDTLVYREDAEEYLKTTSFKHSLEAKALVQLKPLK